MAAMDKRLMNTSFLQARVKDLHALHRDKVDDYGGLVESLNKEADIFLDVIPNYKISPTLDKEVRKQKEVYAVETLEHEVLTQYERFLQLLRKLQKKSHPEQQALGSRLTAKLLPAAHEFNHNDTLIKLTVDYANAKSPRVSGPCIAALETLMDQELVGEPATQLTSHLLKVVKHNQLAVNPRLVQSLLHIRVAMIDVHRPDIAEEKAKNKRMKKEDKELARQMMKGNARRDRAELAAVQTKVLHNVFVVYLRVLQHAQGCANLDHQRKLLAPALEGLAKFAQLVSQEHYGLLMTALRELVRRPDEEIPCVTKLHALVAVACLAQKDAGLDAEQWRVDLTEFHSVLFRCIHEALRPPVVSGSGTTAAGSKAHSDDDGDTVDDTASQGSASSVGTLGSDAFSIAASMAAGSSLRTNPGKEWTLRVSVLIRAIDLLVLSQRGIPAARALAFVRRLLQYTPLVPAHICMALTSVIHRFFSKHPQSATLIASGNDDRVMGRGVYDPAGDDLHACYTESCVGWEVCLLRTGFHPTQTKLAKQFCDHYHRVGKARAGAPPVSLSLNALKPYDILEEFDPAVGVVQPPPPAALPGSKRYHELARLRKAAMKRGRDGAPDPSGALGGIDDDDASVGGASDGAASLGAVSN